MRKFKAGYLGQVLSDLEESGMQPLWKLEIVSKLVGLFPTIYVWVLDLWEYEESWKIFPLLLVCSLSYIRKSKTVQVQCWAVCWICMHVNKASQLIQVCLHFLGLGMKLGIPSHSLLRAQADWWKRRWEPLESPELPQVHLVRLGSSIFMLLFNKILTRFYFFMLFQFQNWGSF